MTASVFSRTSMPSRAKRIRKDLRGVAFFLGQEQRLVLRDGGLRSEAAERLRQLAAERPAADDQQARGSSVRSNTFSLVR